MASFATSYIPTTTAAATRAADVASMTGTNFSSWYRQDEGTFVVNYLCDHAGGPQFASAWYVSSDLGNRFGHSITNINKNVNFDSLTAGVATAYLTSINVADSVSAAFAYKSNDMAAATNGAAVVTDVANTVPAVSTLGIGNRIINVFLNGSISRLAYYPTRLPNAQLQALTA